MTLRSKHIAPIVLAAFLIGIGGTIIFNLWQTTSSKVPATYTSGEFAGEFNPGDIRGSYSFGDIEEAFSVPVAGLAEAFGVEDSENPAAFLCKGLEDMYGQVDNGEIGTDSVRWFVALYTGLPYTPEEDTLLPFPALSVLQERLGEVELEEIKAKTVSLSDLIQAGKDEVAKDEAAPKAAAAAEQADTHTESEAGEVKGKTTFGELQSWGLSKEEIEEALGLPVGKAGVAVRDYCTENGIEFSAVKEALQAAVDRAMGQQ
jgi:hypothetical protein